MAMDSHDVFAPTPPLSTTCMFTA